MFALSGFRAITVALLMLLSLARSATADVPPLKFEWREFENGIALRGNPWSPDNRYLAVSSPEQDAILLVNRETWSVDKRLSLPTVESALSRTAWSPSGRYIAVMEYSHGPIVLDTQDGSTIQLAGLLLDSDGSFAAGDLRWIGDNNVLAVLAARDYAAKIFLVDVAAQAVVRQIDLSSYNTGYFGTGFDWSSRSGLFAVPFDYTNTIGFWDQAGMMPKSLIQPDAAEAYRYASQCGPKSAAVSSPPGFDFLGMGGNVDLVDMQWSHDGMRLAFTIYASTVICSLNTQMTAITEVRGLHIPEPTYDPNNLNTQPYSMPYAVSWSPDDHWLLVGQYPIPPGMIEDSCGIAVFDATQEFAYLGNIGEHFCYVDGVSWSPDGRQLSISGSSSASYWIGTLQSD